MNTYTTLRNGSIVVGEKTVPIDLKNKDYNIVLKEVKDGAATITPYSPPVVIHSVRDKRQDRYIQELSIEGTFAKSVGDVLDGIIDHLYGDTTKLDALKVKIDQIKSDIPKI